MQTLRVEMDEEITYLVEVVRRKNSDIGDLRNRLTNRVRWGTIVMKHKSNNVTKRQVLWWWRCEIDLYRS